MTITTGCVTTREDVAAMAALADRVFFDGTPHLGLRFPRTFSWANRDHLAIAKVGEAIVAAVASYPAELALGENLTLRTVAIGAVCTEPAFRGRGLSSTLLRQVEETATAQGVELLLISGEGPLYQRMGAQKIGRLIEVMIPRAAFSGDPVAYSRHTSVTPPLVDRALADYGTAMPRFVRSAPEFAELLSGHLFTFPFETAALLIPQDRPGYAVVRTGYEGDLRVAFVAEFVGEVATMWSMAMAEAREQGCDKLYVRLDPRHELDPAWNPYVTAIEITGTVKLVNVSSFLEKVKRSVEAVNDSSFQYDVHGEDVRLYHDGDVVFSGKTQELARFLWGNAEGCTAPPTWTLPSFRIDNLNLL